MANRTVTVKASGGDYTSLNAALQGEDDTYADLVTNTMILTFDCYNFEDTTAASTGTGYIVSASYYLNIVAHDSHGGKPSTSSYRLSLTLTAAGQVFNNSESYTRVVGIQLNFACSSGSPSFTHGFMSGNGVQVNGVLFDKCIAKYGSNAGTTQRNAGIWCGTANSTHTIRNCLSLSIKGGSKFSAGVNLSAGSLTLDNCTFYDCDIGIRHEPANSVTARNCLMSSCTDAADSLTDQALTVEYCATNLADFGDGVDEGTGCRKLQTFTFIDAGNYDLHLGSADAGAIGYGTNLYATFQDDIDGDDRGGSGATWDIGADEYVAAGVFLVGFVRQYQARRQ
jgi:hypothetical protein